MALSKIGDVENFSYTGTIQSITLYPGQYKIQLWGAQGGASSWYVGAKGGYTEGILNISQSRTLYIVVGAQGNSGLGHYSQTPHAYNGGGKNNAGTSYSYGSGGGATHCAFRSGVLSSLSSYKNQVCLVAGGGAGAARKASTGVGGGLVGGNSYSGTGTGGTQSSGGIANSSNSASNGSFGQGGSDNSSDGPGGGGGWYGGASGQYTDGAGGGSSYIASFVSKGKTIAGNYSMPSPFSSTETGHSGNGYAKITFVNGAYDINATYDNGFSGINFSPENYNASSKIIVTPILKPGYDWVKWTGDINSNTQVLTINGLTKDITIRANSKPGRANYKVQHWLMKVGGSSYDLEESETIESITGTIVSPNVKTFFGFQSPPQESISVKNDSTATVNYYYIRNKYRITVQNGISQKYEYWYQEEGTLFFDKSSVPPLKVFKRWHSDKQVTITGTFKKEANFLMPNYDVNFSVIIEDYTRLNSNIYKNIFPEEPFDLGYIESLKEKTITSYDEIKQLNHGFQVNDVIAYDSEKGFFKALATTDIKGIRGIVSAVKSTNIFTLMTEGQLDYPTLSFTDTTILYLSDKIPGKLVHYKEIENTCYIPIAIYTDNSIIINVLNGAFGAPLVPYEQPNTLTNFERYNESEIQEIIDAVIGI